MSSAIFDLGLRLRALADNQPVRRASTRHQHLRRDADVVVITTMTGEPDAVWALAYGQWPGGRLGFKTTVADPRDYQSQIEVFSDFGKALQAHHGRQTEDWYPQLVFLNETSWKHVHAAAARLAYTDNPDARYAAEMVLWAAERRDHPGSQAVLVLTGLYSTHWVPPAPEDEQDLLDTWIAAFESQMRSTRPVPRGDYDHPDDARTTTLFDEEVGKKLARFARTRAEARREQAKLHRNRIEAALNPVVAARFKRAQRLLVAYDADPAPVIDGLDPFIADDLNTWQRFRKARDAGFRVARQDRFRAAVFGLQSREQATEAWERHLQLNDHLSRERSVHDGQVIKGHLIGHEADRYIIRTAQPVVRFRSGTDIEVIGQPTMAGTVTRIEADGDHIDVTVTTPESAIVPTSPDTVLYLTEPAVDSTTNERSRINTAIRTKTLAWVHDPDAHIPTFVPRSVPDDLRTYADSLRA